MTGDMPDTTGAWSAENALGSSLRRQQGTTEGKQLCSVKEILRALTQDESFDPSSSGLSSLSILNPHFLILGKLNPHTNFVQCPYLSTLLNEE
jgi:hypothetical protein